MSKFGDLFKEITSALRSVKQYYYHETGKKAWLNKPHPSLKKSLVGYVDSFMWLTSWIEEIWLDSSKSMTWIIFHKNYDTIIPSYTKTYVTEGYSINNRENFFSNPLSCGKISNIYIASIRDVENFDDVFIKFATWFLYNEFFSVNQRIINDSGKTVIEKGILKCCPDKNTDDFYKAALILWKEYFTYFKSKDEAIFLFLKSVSGIKVQNLKIFEVSDDNAKAVINSYELIDDIDYKEKCDEAANLFWSQVRAALKTLEVKPIIPCIFTIGGNTMNTPTYDAFTIFNSNPVYQKCRAALMEEQTLVESGKPGKVMETCSSAELLSYLSFFNTLANFEDKDIQVFCTYLGDDFARAVNNPTVQKEVFFKKREMLPGLTGLYLRYILRVYMNEKYEADTAHSSKHEFLKKIPLIRFSLNDSAAAHEFIEKNEATATIHKYGDCYGTFRLRYAGESDIDNILSMQNADGSDDKNIFIRAGKSEIRRALLNCQLFVVEDMHNDVDINAKATKSNNGKSKSETENPLVAFAILCPDILPYSENGEAGTANYNGKIIEKLEALGYSRNDYSSFNTNFVAKDYRGYGLQRLFLRLLSELSARAGKSGVVCTVSANNKVSYNNFRRAGYEKISDVNYDFDGVEYHRDFLMLRLK